MILTTMTSVFKKKINLNEFHPNFICTNFATKQHIANAFYIEGKKHTTQGETHEVKVTGAPSLAYGLLFTEFYKKISFKLKTSLFIG